MPSPDGAMHVFYTDAKVKATGMGEVSIGIESEKPPLEDTEAANALLLLWERTVARNKRIQTHAPFITNASQAAVHALFRRSHHYHHHQQHPIIPFQQSAPDFPGLPPHYYFSALPPQACMPPQPLLTYYGLMANTPSCYVGPVRMDAASTILPPPPPSVDNHTSASSELDDKGATKKRRSRNSSEKPEGKRRRKNLTKEQVHVLEEAYSVSKYPQVEDRMRLQGPTKLSEARIQVWFQNRRAKERREVDSKMESQHPGAQDANVTTSGFKDHNDNSQESIEDEDETAGDGSSGQDRT